MTGSVHNLGLEGSKLLLDSVSPSGMSPLRKANPSCADGQAEGSSSPAKKNERNLDMKKIEKEMQEIMSPTPLEFHKVCVTKGGCNCSTSMVKDVDHLQPCKKSALLRGTPRNLSLVKLALTKVCSRDFQKVRLRWSPFRKVIGFSCHHSAGFKPGLCYLSLYIRFPGPCVLEFVNWCYR